MGISNDIILLGPLFIVYTFFIFNQYMCFDIT